MERSQCDSNPDVTCSAGLHVAACSYAWAHGGSGYKICVKVNPMNVVAIPKDYENQKMRCCEFVVLAVHEENKPIVAPLVNSEAKPMSRNDFGNWENEDQEHQRAIDEEADAVLWDSRHAASKPVAVKCSNQTENKGWQNLRDSKGRFYRKYN
jgi:hypothetical protein